jgi:hypothetical protein
MDNRAMTSQSVRWSLAIAVGQACLLVTLFALGQREAAPEGTRSAVLEILVPTVVFALAAAVGVASSLAVRGSHLAVLATVWGFEALTIVLTAFLAMALLGELVFGGIG